MSANIFFIYRFRVQVCGGGGGGGGGWCLVKHNNYGIYSLGVSGFSEDDLSIFKHCIDFRRLPNDCEVPKSHDVFGMGQRQPHRQDI